MIDPLAPRRLLSRELLPRLYPWAMAVLAIGLMLWGVVQGSLPRADFVFNNEDEVKSVDPSKAVGNPEHRILDCLFEGLLRLMPAQSPPDDQGVVPLEIVPGVAELPSISPDGLTYTFLIRPDARWSDGKPVTAHDFTWSWRRTLHPDTAFEYAYQLYYLVGAQRYQESIVQVGDAVEVELCDRPDSQQPFPRGTIVRGQLRALVKPAEPAIPDSVTDDERQRIQSRFREQWIYLIEATSRGTDGTGPVVGKTSRTLAAFSRKPLVKEWQYADGGLEFSGIVQPCHHVLIDFDTQVGVRAQDDRTLVVTLHSPTPFFSELTTFYPLFPTPRSCVESYGSPGWTKPGRIVSNGPFVLHTRRLRDRIRLVKNPWYWDRDNVRLEVVDALPLKSRLTGLNMYLNGELDWNHSPPGNMIPYLRDRPDYVQGPALLTYFYRLNVERPGLSDRRVRQALNLALDKQAICDHVTQAGEVPARSVVPLGMPGYTAAVCGDYDPALARQLLADAGFPGGQGFPKLEILLNTDETHKAIAEVIQQQWKQQLGINIDLHGTAWPNYIERMHKIDFDICRAGWIPDYTDPNTFLDLFVTGGLQNSTHWGNSQYDGLIAAAGAEPDKHRRLQLLHDAEAILMDELPILPIYYYVTKNQVRPRVRGFYPNLHDKYPIYALSVEDSPDVGNRQRTGRKL